MSERFGMADGRCFTNYKASRIMNDELMARNNIPVAGNYQFRQELLRGSVQEPQPAECLSSSLLPRVGDSRLDYLPTNK